jgi:hypothetical protein
VGNYFDFGSVVQTKVGSLQFSYKSRGRVTGIYQTNLGMTTPNENAIVLGCYVDIPSQQSKPGMGALIGLSFGD